VDSFVGSLLNFARHHRRASIALLQTVLIVMSYVAAFVLRSDFKNSTIPLVDWDVVLDGLPILLAARLASLSYFGLFRGLWQYVSVPDLVQIIKATAVSTLIFAVYVVLRSDRGPYPESVVLLDAAGNVLALGGIRILTRLYTERQRKSWRGGASQRLLIIGAGDAGAALCREVLRSTANEYQPVAMLDDNRDLKGDSILGVPIVGQSGDIERVTRSLGIDVAIIAMPSASIEQRRNVVDKCIAIGLPFRILPDSPTILLRDTTLSEVRDVEPTDLLLRPSAIPDYEMIRGSIEGARVMITGAAGSVGSELVEQIADLNPASIIAADRSENQLFLLNAYLRDTRTNVLFIPCAIDTADPHQVAAVMAEHRPTVVFHAAAFKHVPLMEDFPASAVGNNIGGTLTVARAAIAHGVDQFVLVSTDKAVKPSSVMGATKQVAERMIWELNDQGSTRFTAVRFGNVLGSNASVVPIFTAQIAKGGPVTVTHEEATRYFMSIPEAAGLILQAAAISTGGEVFLLEMGAPIRIVKLAETLIELSGHTPYEEIDIVFTGMRPGEKIHEELATPTEDFVPTAFPKLLVANNPTRHAEIITNAEGLLADLPGLSVSEVKARLRLLSPDYTPPNHS
jgi:FlaA1/EpsC-like NDP-sugar epimerase